MKIIQSLAKLSCSIVALFLDFSILNSYLIFIDGSLLQSSGLTGVCMAASYSVSRAPGLAVVAMWSQPYDLNLYTAYTGAGVTRDRARYSQGLFYAMYYGSGQWSRRGAGTQAR